MLNLLSSEVQIYKKRKVRETDAYVDVELDVFKQSLYVLINKISSSAAFPPIWVHTNRHQINCCEIHIPPFRT